MSDQMTRDEFERWLACQLALGWTVSNPEAIDTIRAEFRAGATVAPFRKIKNENPRFP